MRAITPSRATYPYRAQISESSDPEFDEYVRKFEAMEKATEKLLKDSKVFCEHVMGPSPHRWHMPQVR